jgi:hypothetical protein
MSKSLKNQVYRKVDDKVYYQIFNKIYIKVLDRVGAQVGDEVMVCDLVMDKVCNQVRKDQGS